MAFTQNGHAMHLNVAYREKRLVGIVHASIPVLLPTPWELLKCRNAFVVHAEHLLHAGHTGHTILHTPKRNHSKHCKTLSVLCLNVFTAAKFLSFFID